MSKESTLHRQGFIYLGIIELYQKLSDDGAEYSRNSELEFYIFTGNHTSIQF